MRDKVTGQCPQTTTFEEKGEPKRYRTEVLPLQYQPNALPLGHTGSQLPPNQPQPLYTSGRPPPTTRTCAKQTPAAGTGHVESLHECAAKIISVCLPFQRVYVFLFLFCVCMGGGGSVSPPLHPPTPSFPLHFTSQILHPGHPPTRNTPPPTTTRSVPPLPPPSLSSSSLQMSWSLCRTYITETACGANKHEPPEQVICCTI